MIFLERFHCCFYIINLKKINADQKNNAVIKINFWFLSTGTEDEINAALRKIREKFPPERFPNVTLSQICFLPFMPCPENLMVTHLVYIFQMHMHTNKIGILRWIINILHILYFLEFFFFSLCFKNCIFKYKIYSSFDRWFFYILVQNWVFGISC